MLLMPGSKDKNMRPYKELAAAIRGGGSVQFPGENVKTLDRLAEIYKAQGESVPEDGDTAPETAESSALKAGKDGKPRDFSVFVTGLPRNDFADLCTAVQARIERMSAEENKAIGDYLEAKGDGGAVGTLETTDAKPGTGEQIPGNAQDGNGEALPPVTPATPDKPAETAEASTSETSETGTPLPADFPARAALEKAGIDTREAIPTDRAGLLALSGIGERQADAILAALNG
jgi:hypothetical protein